MSLRSTIKSWKLFVLLQSTGKGVVHASTGAVPIQFTQNVGRPSNVVSPYVVVGAPLTVCPVPWPAQKSAILKVEDS
jgi:hypothetical protein